MRFSDLFEADPYQQLRGAGHQRRHDRRQSSALTLKLNSAGRALLKRFGKLRVHVSVSAGGKTVSTATVTVTKGTSRRR